MSPRTLALALVAAFLVPTLLLAWIGLGSLREETRRASERHRSQAEAISNSARSELEKLQRDLAAGEGTPQPLKLRFASDGAWLDESGATPLGGTTADAELVATLTDEIDRRQAQGEFEHALTRLVEIATTSSDDGVTAWALDARAALLVRFDRRSEAAEIHRDLIARFPTQRNNSGLLRSFAARLALQTSEPDPLQAAIELYGDVSTDYTAYDQTATAEFLRQLRADLGSRIDDSDAHFEALNLADQADVARSRLRAWRASARRGPTDWVARGAPDGGAVFTAATAPIPSANPLAMEYPIAPTRAGDGEILLAVQRVGDEWNGAMLELDLVFERALEIAQQDPAIQSLGFAATIERRTDSPPGAVTKVELGPPFHEFVIAMRGGDMAAFAASERKRFTLIAGLVALAILVAGIGAWLALRGVGREVAAARGREAFVAAVTHELKTPLAAIRLFAEMLERGNVEPAKVREFGARTMQESDRLARLVDSVLDLARIEHTGSVARRESVDLRKLCEAAIAIVRDYAGEQGFDVALAAGGEEIHVPGDRDALTRALVNLLDNAIKYGEQPHTIEVELTRRADGFAAISVLDRGRGVPESERERIFEAFHRLGDELTRDRPGAGLGLALVARIAAAHGGRAICEAREGSGSRFTLLLPMEKQV